MLSHLVIRNFAIIEHLEIAFEHGLTVLTGETGAGKSIIIDALNLLLGGRASTEVIRTDEDEAIVEGIFELADTSRIDPMLSQQGIELLEGQLLIRRIVSRSGRNKVFINGSLTTVSTLAELTAGLVDISGQHEHYSLMDPERHLDILDAYAQLEGERLRMEAAFAQVRRLRSDLRALRENVRDRLNRIDFLRFQLEEIDAARLREGEEEELQAELSRLKNAEKIAGATQAVVAVCYEDDDSAATRIANAIDQLQHAASYEPRLAEFGDRLEEARIVVEEVARELQGYSDDVEADPNRLDQIQERLEELKRLQRKHGADTREILAHAETMRAELHTLENAEERSEQLEAELRAAERAAFDVARSLSKKRRPAAERMAQAIEAELSDLNMARTRFVVQFEPALLPDAPEDVTLTESGIDTVEFLIAPNVGEAAKPLSKVASGGELSRIMLAIKAVHADRDAISTYIFDEVDTGIGGPTADMVGIKLARTAEAHQVLCITHLPQIASRGTHHYLVEKRTISGRTQSLIRPLGEQERIDEIARMLGGARVSDKTRDAARELLGG